MKSYFIIRDFFTDCATATSADIALKSFKVNDIETLTNQFFVDTQSDVQVPVNQWDFCLVNADGTNPQPATPTTANSFNPFPFTFLLTFDQINGLFRGDATGTVFNHNFGNEIHKFGVDKPAVLTVGGGLQNGALYVDIDFTKNLYIEFDVLINNVIVKKYKMQWKAANCSKSYSYFSALTGFTYNDDGFAFLRGQTVASSQSPALDLSVNCSTIPETDCFNKERTRSFALYVKIPKVAEDPEISFKECCYKHIVFGDAGSSDDFKNDYSAFFHQKQLPNETCNFFLYRYENSQEYPLNSATYGDYFPFGSFSTNANLKGCRVQWKKVLAALGSGNYKIIKRQVIANVPIETASFVFTLRQYSTREANHTVRIDTITNGLFEETGVDFSGTFWKDSIRVPGFFGRREPKYTTDNLIDEGYRKDQISMSQTNEYKFQTNNIPGCVQEYILDFAVFADEIFLNDYNLNNTSYKYIKFPVDFSSNDNTNFASHKRKAVLNLTFTDRFENRIKRNYNG